SSCWVCCDATSLRSFSVATAHAPSPPKPHSGGIASGAGSKTRQKGPHQPTTLTLCLQRKSSRFCKEYRGFYWRSVSRLRLGSPSRASPNSEVRVLPPQPTSNLLIAWLFVLFRLRRFHRRLAHISN